MKYDDHFILLVEVYCICLSNKFKWILNCLEVKRIVYLVQLVNGDLCDGAGSGGTRDIFLTICFPQFDSGSVWRD